MTTCSVTFCVNSSLRVHWIQYSDVRMKYDHISYLNTAERTSCADSSVCSHTRQALRGKETYGALCIHFGSKIAKPSPLMSIYGIMKWFEWSGDIMFALARHARMPTYPMALTFFFFFCMNLISTSAVLSCLHCFWGLAVQARPYFTPNLILVE